eukprot:g9854.t1
MGKTKLAVVYKGSSEKEKALEHEVGSLKKQLETMREVYEAGLYNQQQQELLTARAQIAQIQAELAQVRLESQDRELAQTLRTQTLEGELKREREIKEMQTRQLRRLAGKVAEQEQQKAQPMVTSGSGSASDQSQTRQQQQIIQALGEEKAQLQKELQHVHAELEDNFTLKATVRSLEQSGRLLKQQVMKLTKENRKLSIFTTRTFFRFSRSVLERTRMRASAEVQMRTSGHQVVLIFQCFR